MIAIVCALALTQAPSNWNELTQTLEGKSGAHRYRIVIECANFEPRGRKISWVKDGYNYFPAISGKRAWGFDGWGAEEIKTKPVTEFLKKRAIEIRKFEVTVKGKKWPVSSKLTFDLLNLNLGHSGNFPYGVANLSKDAKTLTLKQSASDGSGGYKVRFMFHKNAKTLRQILLEGVVAETRRG